MKNMKQRVVYGSGLAGLSGSAMAAVPVEVTTAMGDAATDGAAMGTLALLVVVAIAAIKYLKRAV